MTDDEPLRIRAYSPDRSIKVTYEEGGDLLIVGHPERSKTHSEAGLAEQMQHGLTAFLEECSQGRPAHHGRESEPPDMTLDNGVRIARERQRRVDDRLRDAGVTSWSPQRCVAVGLHPLKGFRVAVTSGAFLHQDVSTVIEEANLALSNVLLKAQDKARKIHQELFEDLGADTIGREIRERQNQSQ